MVSLRLMVMAFDVVGTGHVVPGVVVGQRKEKPLT
jgi:hypothetical protein